jgi:threonine dehydrogenase-like Zn-dependent dehydrogenase
LETMKAAVYYGPGDIRLKEIERPHASPEGAVLRVKASGVCNIVDLPAWKNWPEGGQGIGLVRGHEFSGDLVEVGSRVTDFKVGDRIFSEPVYRPCYRCEACRQKDYWRCIHWGEGEIGRAINGAFAEYLAIPFLTKMNAIKTPETLSYHDLILIDHLGLGAALARRAERGKVVVVLGQDLTGIATVALLKKRGVSKVIASDISKIRRKAAEDAGADLVIDAVNQDAVQVVMKETDGIGADNVIICDERPTATFQAMNMVQHLGTIWTTRFEFLHLNPAMVPVHPAASAAMPPEAGAYIEQAVSLSPSLASMQFGFGYGQRLSRYQEALELLQSGKLSAAKLVTHVFPLDKIKEAFETAVNPHQSIRVLVEP